MGYCPFRYMLLNLQQARCGDSVPTCEELECRVRLGAHDLDPAEEGERDSVLRLGERLDVPAVPGLGVPELSAGEGQHVEVRGAQLPVQLLQRPVVLLRLLAVTRHVYNQGRLQRGGGTRVRSHTHTWRRNSRRNSCSAGEEKFAQMFPQPDTTHDQMMMMMMKMWTYFSSVLLQRHRPPLRVFDLERIKVSGSSGLHLGLQEEQAPHTHRHAQQHRQLLLGFGVGGPGRVAP